MKKNILLTLACLFVLGLGDVAIAEVKISQIVEKTLQNLKELKSIDDFDVLLAKKKKKTRMQSIFGG